MAGRLAAAIAAVALILAPVSAQAAACWTPQAIDAARVQQFEAMLMSVSLRCRTTGVDLADHFELFRDTHKLRLEHVMAVLSEHYEAAQSREGKRNLDHFLIQLANGFGGGKSDGVTCQSFRAVLAELNGTPAAEDALESFAFAMVRDPYIDGPRCEVSLPGRSGASPAKR